MLHATVGLLDNSAHIDSYIRGIYYYGEWLGLALILQAINALCQKRVQPYKTRFFVHIVKDLELLCRLYCTYTHASSDHAQGRRNVFTTGLAKLDHEDYAIKCVGV